MVRRNGVKVVVIDYLGLIHTEPNLKAIEAVTQVSKSCKWMARSLGVTVVALCQLNRGVEARDNKRPAMSDLRDSGSLEQDADTVLFLHPKAELGEGAVLVAALLPKNRQGPRGRFALEFNGRIQRWTLSTADVSRGSSGSGGRTGRAHDFQMRPGPRQYPTSTGTTKGG
jgi:replicative DNA helicase